MAQNKKTSKPAPSSPVSPSGSSKKETPHKDAPGKPESIEDAGQVAYEKLRPRLEAIPADQILPPRADVRAAASAVLSRIVPTLSDPTLSARFLSLPKAEFDAAVLEEVKQAASAVLFAQSALVQAEAGTTQARLPGELVEDATVLRQKMLRVCEYHFGSDPELARQLADIRSGHGYLDLAEDLRRLSGLYQAQKATLKQDLRFYDAADEGLALRLCERITSELRVQGPQAARQTAWRAWAFLVDRYQELSRGAVFLLREAAAQKFPSLFSLGRSAPKAAGKTHPSPVDPSAP